MTVHFYLVLQGVRHGEALNFGKQIGWIRPTRISTGWPPKK